MIDDIISTVSRSGDTALLDRASLLKSTGEQIAGMSATGSNPLSSLIRSFDANSNVLARGLMTPDDFTPSAPRFDPTLPTGRSDRPARSPNTTAGRGGVVDHRIRLRPFPDYAETLYGDSDLMDILRQTNGVIFPYTPQIGGLSHRANYDATHLVHSNQEHYSYRNSNGLSLTISGDFTASNWTEAAYMLAAYHFLRSCTKMHFGDSEPTATRGLPPPPLLLSGYGKFIFNDVPVLLTDASISFDMDSDLVPVHYPAEEQEPLGWVHVRSTISVSLVQANTPKRMREFNFREYVSGTLLTKGKGGLV